MTTVSTGSRLHFGLFNAGNIEGPQFGGLGLMIDSPRVKVSVFSSETWQARGLECERALEAARKLADRPFEVVVESLPPLHSGLGVGTQLALSTGRAIATELGISLENEELAQIVGRGLRSGIGVRGFHTGGFILDHGHNGIALSPTERIAWPESWRILLIRPHVPAAWHGSAETRAFARQRDCTAAMRIERELRFLSGEVASALKACEFDTFGEQLFQFNRLAGEAFAEDQGGTYSSKAVTEIVQWFRDRGLRGVGQSSWGPTVFAMVKDEESTAWQTAATAAFAGIAVVETASGANSGFESQSR